MENFWLTIGTVIVLFVQLFQQGVCFCPAGCQCNMTSYSVSCIGVDLKNFPILLNPRCRHLNLRRNRISSVSADMVGLYADLSELDLGHNQIASLTSHTFVKLDQLEVLDLSFNKLSVIGINDFTGLRSLHSLDLSHNSLQRLPTSTFSALRGLKELNLGGNNIMLISSGAFTGLHSLTELHLQQNKLTKLPKDALQSVSSLRVLNLAHNRLNVIPGNAFSNLEQLEELDLEGNILEAIPDDAFIGCHELRLLDLSYNQLHVIPTLAFRGLSSLETFRISGNPIGDIQTSSFEGLSSLLELDVCNVSNLEAVHLNAFSGMYKLQALRLTDNWILSDIHPLAFEPGVTLREFHISGNNLSSLHLKHLNYNHITTLDVRDNPWICSCEVTWMGPILRETPRSVNTSVEPATCENPETGESMTLSNLDHYLAECDPFSLKMILLKVSIMILTLSILTLLLYLGVRKARRLCAGPNAAAAEAPAAEKEYPHEFSSHRLKPMDSEETAPETNVACVRCKSGGALLRHERSLNHYSGAYSVTSDYYSSASLPLSPSDGWTSAIPFEDTRMYNTAELVLLR